MKKVETILEKAARYDLENNERLYHSIRKLRKYGGTLAMSTYWKNVKIRTESYNQIIESEIQRKVIIKTKRILMLLTILNSLLWLYI